MDAKRARYEAVFINDIVLIVKGPLNGLLARVRQALSEKLIIVVVDNPKVPDCNLHGRAISMRASSMVTISGLDDYRDVCAPPPQMLSEARVRSSQRQFNTTYWRTPNANAWPPPPPPAPPRPPVPEDEDATQLEISEFTITHQVSFADHSRVMGEVFPYLLVDALDLPDEEGSSLLTYAIVEANAFMDNLRIEPTPSQRAEVVRRITALATPATVSMTNEFIEDTARRNPVHRQLIYAMWRYPRR